MIKYCFFTIPLPAVRKSVHSTSGARRHTLTRGASRAEIPFRIDNNLTLFTKRPPNNVAAGEFELLSEWFYDARELSFIVGEIGLAQSAEIASDLTRR